MSYVLFRWLHGSPILLLLLLVTQESSSDAYDEAVEEEVDNQPLLYVFLSVRNKEHALPYFLTYFEQINYPRNRMVLHVRADHCKDRTIDILDEWLKQTQKHYFDADIILDRTLNEYEKASSESLYESDQNIVSHIIQLKTEAMVKAKQISSDYILFLDTDAFLTDRDVINKMIKVNETIVAPMLTSLRDHANFWGAMNKYFYYESSDLYSALLAHTKVGCFRVPMVHSCVLINLNDPNANLLTFDPAKTGISGLPHDDLIVFSMSAQKVGVSPHICNEEEYGFIEYPRPNGDPFDVSQRLMLDLVVESYRKKTPLAVGDKFKKHLRFETPDTAGLSQIYYLNLDRRPDRRKVIEEIFRLSGLMGKRVKAVDGRSLSEKRMKELGVHIVDGYLDPLKKRPMTMGEVGCLLSHYKVWKHMIKNHYSEVLILEDDAQFQPNFKANVKNLLSQTASVNWDVIYLGYKFVYGDSHTSKQVDDTPNLRTADYVYWGVGYLLSYAGAKKLIAADPLGNAMPVDEFLPIMFDQTDQVQWKHLFPNRNVRAFVHHPPLLEPRFFLGDDTYVSDTEFIGPGNEQAGVEHGKNASVSMENKSEGRVTGDEAFVNELLDANRHKQRSRIDFERVTFS